MKKCFNENVIIQTTCYLKVELWSEQDQNRGTDTAQFWRFNEFSNTILGLLEIKGKVTHEDPGIELDAEDQLVEEPAVDQRAAPHQVVQQEVLPVIFGHSACHLTRRTFMFHTKKNLFSTKGGS